VGLGSRGFNIFENGGKAIISEECVALTLYYYAKFYSPYSGLFSLYETCRFTRFLRVFFKPMACGVSLGSRGQGYELNVVENRRESGHFRRSVQPAYFTIMLSFTVHVRA